MKPYLNTVLFQSPEQTFEETALMSQSYFMHFYVYFYLCGCFGS